MKLKKWVAGLGVILVAALGGLSLAQADAHAVGPGAVVKSTGAGDGNHGIWP